MKAPSLCATSAALVLPLMLGTSYVHAAHAGAAAGNVSPADSGNAAALAPWLARRIAIQLYSFHNKVDGDLPGTLRRIRNLGFQRI